MCLLWLSGVISLSLGCIPVLLHLFAGAHNRTHALNTLSMPATHFLDLPDEIHSLVYKALGESSDKGAKRSLRHTCSALYRQVNKAFASCFFWLCLMDLSLQFGMRLRSDLSAGRSWKRSFGAMLWGRRRQVLVWFRGHPKPQPL